MTQHWDEFSKSLAEESLPRRESLRRLGFLFAGAVLSPLGLGTAWAGGRDPCRTFCNRCPKSQRNNCLAVCNACNSDPHRLAGSCGSYTCCAVAACNGVCSDLRSDANCGACGNNCSTAGLTCCGYAAPEYYWYCADLADDFYNCGGCGNVCDEAGPNEFGACVAGTCVYDCVEGATNCNGACTFLDSDPYNCGGCGNVCLSSAPHCVRGECMQCPASQEMCGDTCTDLHFDPFNCGACGYVCGADMICDNAVCAECAPGLTFCAVQNFAYCTDLLWDQYNCGACGNVCDSRFEYCLEGGCAASVFYDTGDYGY